MVAWLEAYAERAAREAARSARLRVRRLNRAEYDNTARDLLGVDPRPAEDFPQHTPGHGFDTVAGTLTVSAAGATAPRCRTSDPGQGDQVEGVIPLIPLPGRRPGRA